MKNGLLLRCGRTALGLSIGVAALTALNIPVTAAADAVIVPVAVNAPRYNLYVDPYNGNTVNVGGFSGLFPVPDRPNWFFAVTDRGPNPDYVDGTGGLPQAGYLQHFGQQPSPYSQSSPRSRSRFWTALPGASSGPAVPWSQDCDGRSGRLH